MNPSSILRLLALSVGSTGLLAVIPLVVALVSQEWPQAVALAGTLFGSAFVLILVLVLVPKSEMRRFTVRDGLVTLIGWWVITPALALPVFIAGVPNSSLISAYFESVSCLTTTGVSQSSAGFLSLGILPESLLVWRGVLHFVGGAVSLASVLTIFPALNFGGTGLQRSRLFAGTEGRMEAIFLRGLGIGGSVIGAVFVLMTASFAVLGVAPERAFSLGMSVATTGLVHPLQDKLVERDAWVMAVATLGLAISAISATTLLSLRHWPKRLTRDLEAMAVIVVIVTVGFLVNWLAAHGPGGPGYVWAASSVATSGIMTEPLSIGLGEQAVFLSMLLAFVGGAALSTAGGVKMARIMILAERSRVEFSRLGYQNSVAPFVFRGRLKSDVAVVGVWVYLVSYMAAMLLLAVLLSLGGREFGDALVSAVGLISNAGHLVTQELGGLEKLVGAIGMVLGRIEVLALLPLMRPGFWRS